MATIIGTGSADTLEGTDAGDSIYGLSGNDRLKGGGGADRLDGGAGTDTAFYSDSWAGVTVNLDAGRGYYGTAQDDRLFNIENLYGSFHNDVLIGTEAANVFYGLNGNDTLIGGGGDDTLDGSGGDDTLKGGGGADRLVGGSGFDTADYSQSFQGVHVDLLYNFGSYYGDAEGDTFSGIENLTGSAYRDLLEGDNGANVLTGLNGQDSLWGRDGDDRLEGGPGDDQLDGGAGLDTMIGGQGNDSYFIIDSADVVIEAGGQGDDIVYTDVSYSLPSGADAEWLIGYGATGTEAINLTGNSSGNVLIGNDGTNILSGGDGNDQLRGQGGQDAFLFTTPLNAAFNVDVITDFNVTDDTIMLNGAIFSGIGLGSVAGSQFVTGPAAQDAGDRIIYDSGTGAVYYDSDGTGAAAAIQFAELSPGLPLTNFDFHVNYYF